MLHIPYHKEPEHTRVVVAMSGGVDSSVVAASLKKQGYEVIGITLQLYDYGAALAKKGACCAGQDIYDAKRVSEIYNFPHYVFDYESKFRESVIEDFADSYIRGETPIPCVRCNQSVKFLDLLQAAQDLNADFLATGHYVQRLDGTFGPELHQAIDPFKDQSYFLFATTKEQLSMLRFPLGNKTKAETREMARALGLNVAEKPDSQNICFVPDGNYASIVNKFRPGAIEPGNIVDLKGNIIGRHDGIIHYTIGQRKGLNIGGLETPLYVLALKPESHEVIVGPKEHLLKHRIDLKEINWLGYENEFRQLDWSQGLKIKVKIRSIQEPVSARLFLKEPIPHVILDQGLYGISPGQACVFYLNQRCLGGGWMTAAS